jgi:serine/threonine protein phosphatase PrpC
MDFVTTVPCIEAAGASRAGVYRRHNEDSFAVVPHLGLFLVADGVGGAAGGEVASRMAIDTIRSYYEGENANGPLPLGLDTWEDREQARFVLSLWRANRRIHDAARHSMTTRGMATTFAGITVSQRGFCVAHVGDSRVYRLRNGELELLTEDHSLRNEYLREGGVLRTARAGLDGVNLDTLIRALGLSQTVKVDCRLEPAVPGDRVLVCTDGLTGPVPEDEIAAILSEPAELDVAVQRLIERAQSRGGRDDITTILVRWKDAWSAPEPFEENDEAKDEAIAASHWV